MSTHATHPGTDPTPGPTPGPAASSTSLRHLAAGSLALLAATLVADATVLAGTPNPGMAALAVLPLAALVALRSRRRWATAPALLAVAAAAAVRASALSFDLVRPGTVLPFAVAVLELLALGGALAAAVALLAGGGGARSRWAGPAAGLGAAAAIGALLLVASPQDRHTGDLSAEQVRALPVVETTNYRFGPSQLRFATGDDVALRLVNGSDDPHRFAVEELGVDVLVPSGRERVVVLEDVPAGTHRITCTEGSHLEDGMQGRLTVVAPGAGGAVADSAQPAGHHHG